MSQELDALLSAYEALQHAKRRPGQAERQQAAQEVYRTACVFCESVQAGPGLGDGPSAAEVQADAAWAQGVEDWNTDVLPPSTTAWTSDFERIEPRLRDLYARISYYQSAQAYAQARHDLAELEEEYGKAPTDPAERAARWERMAQEHLDALLEQDEAEQVAFDQLEQLAEGEV